MTGFDGKAILVTGGTSGIGAATALAFAEAGARVAILGRSREAGEEIIDRIGAAGGSGRLILADLADASATAAAVAQAAADFGTLDCVVNAAGVEADGRPLMQGDEALYDHIMTVNVKGVWAVMRAALAIMSPQGRGAIVNVSSVGGLIGFAQSSIYSASKHAVIGLTKAAALEHAAQGIRVNAVAPGTVDTPMFRRFGGDDPAVRDYVTALHPAGRIGRAEEIAAAILWLCSDAATFVTGQTLAIDGGFTAQ